MYKFKSLPSELKYGIIDPLVKDNPRIIHRLLQVDRDFHAHTIASLATRIRIDITENRVVDVSRSLFQSAYDPQALLFDSPEFIKAFAPLYKFQEKDSKIKFIDEVLDGPLIEGNGDWRACVSRYYSDIHASEITGEIPAGSLSKVIDDSIEELSRQYPGTEAFKNSCEAVERGRPYFNKDHKIALRHVLQTEEKRKDYEGVAGCIQSNKSLPHFSNNARWFEEANRLLQHAQLTTEQMKSLEAFAKNLRALSDQLENAHQNSADFGKPVVTVANDAPVIDDKPSNPRKMDHRARSKSTVVD